MLTRSILFCTDFFNNRIIQSNVKILCSQKYNKNLSISFTTSPGRDVKQYLDTENKFAHEVLQESPKNYQIFRIDSSAEDSTINDLPSIVLDSLSTDAPSSNDAFSGFCALAQLCSSSNTEVCITDARFKPFTELFCRLANGLSDEQLLRALQHLAKLPSTLDVRSANYVDIWNALDAVCARRTDKWNIDELLMYCDAWYTLNLGRICDFVWDALYQLSRKIKRMRPEQLVHTMFFCNVVRKPIYNMIEFEVNLLSAIDNLSLQELGVIALGFFKTQTTIKNAKLVEKLYQRLLKEVHIVEDITLVSLLKVLRYSSRLPQEGLMEELLERLCPQIERLSLFSCLHIALLGSDIQLCHESSLERLLWRFNAQLAEARLKDFERVCMVLTVYNYDSPSGIDRLLSLNILKQLRVKVEEILKHPRCFPRCLHFLTIKGFYDQEMISSVLEPRFLRHAYGKSLVMGREIFQLDSFVKINLKDANYTGHQLLEKQRRTMGKLLTQYIPEKNSKHRTTFTDRTLLEVKDSTENLFRITYFKHILPHFERPDIVVCYDCRARRAVEISPECPEDYSGAILTRKELLGAELSTDIDTVVFVVSGWNNNVRRRDRHTGLFDLKLTQLKLLNHKHIVVYWQDWKNLETKEHREDFLRRKLAQVTNLSQ